MAKLSDALKPMLAGLAHQYDVDYLTTHEKLKALGEDSLEARIPPPFMPKPKAVKPVTKRIALVSDGRGMDAPLDYAIDACLRQDARIDLLIHGTVDTESISRLQKQIRQAGVDYQCIQLGVNTVDEIFDYIGDHSSLIFLVAVPDDSAVKVLMEEVIPRRGGRIPVPLVLIESQSAQVSRQSAA